MEEGDEEERRIRREREREREKKKGWVVTAEEEEGEEGEEEEGVLSLLHLIENSAQWAYIIMRYTGESIFF